MAQTLLFHGPAQTKAHSPELIFHIMKSRDQTSVFSYLCNSVCIVWPRRHYQCKRCPLQQLPMRLLQNHQDFFLLSHFCLLHFVRLYPSLTFVHRSRQLKSWGGQLKGLKLNNNIVCRFFFILEIKPCWLGPIIWDLEAFWYKIDKKIIYLKNWKKKWEKNSFLKIAGKTMPALGQIWNFPPYTPSIWQIFGKLLICWVFHALWCQWWSSQWYTVINMS